MASAARRPAAWNMTKTTKSPAAEPRGRIEPERGEQHQGQHQARRTRTEAVGDGPGDEARHGRSEQEKERLPQQLPQRR